MKYSWVYDIYIYTSSTRTRRGRSCLKEIYIRPFSSIELACAVRQPSPCVRALCETGVLFHMSHLKLHVTLHTSRFTRHTSHFALHSSHSTLHSSHFTVHTSHFSLHTSHFTFHTSHSTLHTALFALETSHFTLHTPHFTLHSSCPTLSHLSSSHLIPAQLFSSLLICHLNFHESLPSTTIKELACAVRQPGPCVRALCAAVAVLLSKNMTLYASPVQCNVKQALSSHITLHSLHFTSELFSSGFMSSHMSATFFLAIFMSSERSSNFLMRWAYFQPISALLHVSKVERNSRRFCYMPKGVDHRIFTILRSLMPSVDALHQIATASVNMA